MIKKNLRQSRKTVHKVNESFKMENGRFANKEERSNHPAFLEYKQWVNILKAKQSDGGNVVEETEEDD